MVDRSQRQSYPYLQERYEANPPSSGRRRTNDDDYYAQHHQYQSKNNPSRRHNQHSRRRGSNNSFTRKRHYYSSQPDDDVSISIRQLQQRNRRLLFLAAMILAAITWVNNSNNNTAVLFRDSTAVKTDAIQRIGKVKKDSSSNTNDVSNEQENTDVSSSFYKIKKYPSSHDIQSSKLKLKRDNNQVMIPSTTQSNTTTLTTRNKQQGKWEPCSSKKYELERHDYESGHGDICRIKGGILSTFICPSGCHETFGGAPPYCVQDTTADLNKLVNNNKPCRARNPNAEPEYRCDDVGVCILAVAPSGGSSKGQFKGSGQYFDDTCDGMCGDRITTAANNDGVNNQQQQFEKNHGVQCNTDLDCSLAGICLPHTKTCLCDAWADGSDCSYLKFQPVNKSRLGYMNERHSSWGGSVVYSPHDGMYHMYVSEILCKSNNLNVARRCGLSAWETHSRVVVAKSANVDGPYYRNNVTDPNEDELVGLLLPPEHHNPSIHVSSTGEWHLFTISGSSGPIERIISKDQGRTWSEPIVLSPRQNPGPVLRPDGSTYLFYRADGLDLPSPTCSNEGIAMQICPVADACHEPNDIPLFGHTGEDPSVFIDHRGNYHMLFNALPYKCVPKFNQGGHAWSQDGITWSANPRVGAFDTSIQFTDGTSIKCERRERPQMIVGADGKPVALITGLTGCPKGLMADDVNYDYDSTHPSGGAKYYKGGDDSFTLVQLMAT